MKIHPKRFELSCYKQTNKRRWKQYSRQTRWRKSNEKELKNKID